MRDDLGDFGRLDAVIERDVQVIRHLDRLVARDQRGKRDNAAVAYAEARAFPHVAKQRVLRVFFKRGRHHADVLTPFGLIRLR